MLKQDPHLLLFMLFFDWYLRYLHEITPVVLQDLRGLHQLRHAGGVDKAGLPALRAHSLNHHVLGPSHTGRFLYSQLRDKI